jgi:undecaprenyl diphosphate synthase
LNTEVIPQHLAIVMDGNGRWAKKRKRPRPFGHRAGVQNVRTVVQQCLKLGIPVLTLFAFSSENWARPRTEVKALMNLFMRALKKEAAELKERGVRLRFIGDLSRFADALRAQMLDVQNATAVNAKLTLNIAVNYGGRWEIVEAAKQIARAVKQGLIDPEQLTEDSFTRYTTLADLPDPDLFIRTGGEFRISNFLLWHLAYTELYVVDTLWPDFDAEALQLALADFAKRERRFGKTAEQMNVQALA